MSKTFEELCNEMIAAGSAPSPAVEVCPECHHEIRFSDNEGGICEKIIGVREVTEAQRAALHQEFQDDAGVVRCGHFCIFLPAAQPVQKPDSLDGQLKKARQRALDEINALAAQPVSELAPEHMAKGLNLFRQLVGGRNALRDLGVFACNHGEHDARDECFWEECEAWAKEDSTNEC